MCRALLCAAMLLAASQDLFASAKTDSIVTFLGGAQAKFVFQKFAWCTDDFKPKAEAAAKAEGWSLQLLDTRAGAQSTLVTGLQDCFLVRISRSGKWATFIGDNGTNCYIVDLTAASPAKKLLMNASACSYWAVSAWWIDPANGDEWAYCLDNPQFQPIDLIIGGGSGIYKVKLNSDGTVDKSTATKLTISGLSGSPAVDITISVSADGKKVGGAFPWPTTDILDVATGRLDTRHMGTFGCQANLAPDNSYRFFHCDGDHYFIWMFDANMSTTNWQIPFKTNLAGLTGSANPNFLAPRWTNHVQFYTCTWPMDGDGNAVVVNSFNSMGVGQDFVAADGSSLWGKSASWVQTQMDMNTVTQFYLGKFSSDFKTQEKTISIARDARYFQGRGDAWICNGTTYGSQCTPVSTLPAIRGNPLRGLSVVQSGAFVNVHADAAATVRIIDARGRLVRQATGSGSITVDTRDLAVGAYIVSADQHGDRLTRHVTIAR